MNPVNPVQQNMLERMEQMRALAQTEVIKPAAFGQVPAPGGVLEAFDQVLRGVDSQQHQAAAMAAAVDSGKSDDLVGAMIESQKASVSFSALIQVRNKINSAFEEVMRTPM